VRGLAAADAKRGWLRVLKGFARGGRGVRNVVAGKAAATRHHFLTSFGISSLCPRRPRPSTGSLSSSVQRVRLRGTGTVGCPAPLFTGALGAGHVRPWACRSHLTHGPSLLLVHAAPSGRAWCVSLCLPAAARKARNGQKPLATSWTLGSALQCATGKQLATGDRGTGHWDRQRERRMRQRTALPPPFCSSAPTATD
jgi:hypothetical protein